jgi:hypothetical protein
MGRCLSLFGMVVFTAGVVALVSIAKGSLRQPLHTQPATVPVCDPPHLQLLNARAFHASFSLN